MVVVVLCTGLGLILGTKLEVEERPEVILELLKLEREREIKGVLVFSFSP